MKKWTIALAGALTASLVLAACGQKNEQKTTASSSSKVSSTSSTSSEKSGKSAKSTGPSSEAASNQGESVSSAQQSSEEEKKAPRDGSKEDKQPAAVSSLDMNAIAAGDFTSMAGTWQDANGVSYTFDAAGLASDVAKLETGAYSGPDENGIYRAGIRWNNATGAAFLIIPAGKSLPAEETVNGVDPTDTSQDRFIIAQSLSEHPDVFYRVK